MTILSVNSNIVQQNTHKYQDSTIQIEKNSQLRYELPPLELPNRDELARDIKQFADKVRSTLKDYGISIPPEPSLTSDDQGYVRVSNSHPHKQRIEQLFSENRELQQQYAKISANSSLYRAADRQSQFTTEYEQLTGDIMAQRELVESEMARNRAPFHLMISTNGSESFFSTSTSA